MNRKEALFLCCCVIIAFVSLGFPLFLYSIAAVETGLFSKPLFSNGYRIVAYFAVVA
jgi:hypothetical protein